MVHYNFRPKIYKLIRVKTPLAQTAVKAVGEFVKRDIYRAEFVKSKTIIKSCNTRAQILGVIHEHQGKKKVSIYGKYEGSKKDFFGEIKFNRILNNLEAFNKFINYRFDSWRYKKLLSEFKKNPHGVIRRFKRSRIYTWLYSKCKMTLKEFKRFKTLKKKNSRVVKDIPTYINEYGKKILCWSSENMNNETDHEKSETIVTFCNFYFIV